MIPTLAVMAALSLPLVPTTPATMTTTRAQEIAAAAWGNPCGGAVQVEKVSLGLGVAAEAVEGGCTVYFNTDADWNWPDYCSVMVHEYGHLAGYGHSTTRKAIMYPTLQETWKYCLPKRHWHIWKRLTGFPVTTERE